MIKIRKQKGQLVTKNIVHLADSAKYVADSNKYNLSQLENEAFQNAKRTILKPL